MAALRSVTGAMTQVGEAHRVQLMPGLEVRAHSEFYPQRNGEALTDFK